MSFDRSPELQLQDASCDHKTCISITGNVLRSQQLFFDHMLFSAITRDALRSQGMPFGHRSALRLQATVCGQKASLDQRTHRSSPGSASRTLNTFALSGHFSGSADVSCEVTVFFCHVVSGCTFDYRPRFANKGHGRRSQEAFCDLSTCASIA